MVRHLVVPLFTILLAACSMLADVEAMSLRGRSDLEKAKIKSEYPYYHTSSELSAQLRSLSATCSGATFKVDTVREGNVELEVAHVVRSPASAKAPTNRIFVVAGEHAREMIGPETSLRFLQKLCDPSHNSTDALEDAEFKVVLNANPLSRVRVENGEYCLRSNPNGIDLNRNWDEAWSQPMTLKTEQGEKPFSETETRLLRKLITDFRPITFLSIHSGTLGLYMPWAWSVNQLATRNQKEMMSVLQAVDQAHCKCPYGAAGKEVGYPCPGTSVDWVYEKMMANYSFAFEVWVEEGRVENLRERWKTKKQKGGAMLLEQGTHQFQDADYLGLAQTAAKLEQLSEQQDPSSCFGQFNPPSEQQFKKVVENWANAYLLTTKKITQHLQTQSAF